VSVRADFRLSDRAGGADGLEEVPAVRSSPDVLEERL